MTASVLARAGPLALVAGGGFAGATLRHLTGEALPGLGGTLVVNVLGSFVLGFVLYEALYTGIVPPEARLAVSTGFLSSFTTYSTFALQSALAPRPLLAVGNVLANYALGFAAVLVGRRAARAIDSDAGGGR